MKKSKKFLLLLMIFVCMGCVGCAERKPAADQGELVQNETVGEIWQSFLWYNTLPLVKKMVR